MGGSSDCDVPELSLRLGGGSGGDDYSLKPSRDERLLCGESEERDRQAERERRQPENNKITIFYNGLICVCDVTEFQARAIISMARREMEEKENNNSSKNNSNQVREYQQQSQQQQKEISAPNLQNPQLLNSGLSMKRSLQRFLQKRKTRITAISPYNHRSNVT